MASRQVLIGVIGGSGLYNLENLTPVETANPKTPWGLPSSPITLRAAFWREVSIFSETWNIAQVSFILPSDVPARANIAALKSLGVKVIVAFSAVGSLREQIHPGDFVVPDQASFIRFSIIDRTKGVRPASFFEGTSIVAHAMFGDPFDTQLTKALIPMIQNLAREAEISYALVATATDYDAWRVSEEPVTVAEVYKTLSNNADRSRKITATILEELHEIVERGDVLTSAEGGMQYSLITRDWPEEDRKKLAFVLPKYFSKSEAN
ncbi:5'-methylthioadenosine phosphorylase [Rhizoctonia solani]|uniref:5'-methylthioadenosine phosphorylase n=1 Tax=Rhizoctonia solani TaxID=456999 RepID=A0A8H8SS58_9AGAM|nr:5'-methylthioadenosine phosphorylase [Rhizoctonia solani]QRW15644.1 5'-methylthioadenosine phosphorylase [Rhizoctonia solani]